MSGLMWCAAALIGLAIAVALPDPGRTLRSRLAPPSRRTSRWGRTPGERPPWHPLRCSPRWRRRSRRPRHSRRATVDDEVLVREACEALGAELRVGRHPAAALLAAAEVLPVLRPAALTARVGGDVSVVLRRLQVEHELLRPLAVAWEVADRTGAGLGRLLAGAVTDARHRARLRQEVSAQLAGPRASARLLAGLPVLGLLLGGGLAADPMRFLLTTPYGLGCLGLGVALIGIGIRWVEQLAREAETGR